MTALFTSRHGPLWRRVSARVPNVVRRVLPAMICIASAAGAQRVDARAQSAVRVPANAPLRVVIAGDRVEMTYDGRRLLDAHLTTRGRLDIRSLADTASGAITQVIKFTAFGDSARVTLTGLVAASAEGFPVEAEPRTDALPVVRNASGLSHNRLNRGVYDRQRDWLLSVDAPARVRVTPGAGADSTRFAVDASGFEVAIRFRPRFFARHRGVSRFAPWMAPVKRASVAGWTSWFAFVDTITEAHIRATAAVFADALLPFGYTVLQVDDGYQRLPLGPPANWLRANAKFPSGVDGLRRLITQAGLVPGIWTNVAFEDTAYARAHAGLFVRDAYGKPAYGNWIGFPLDGSSRAALDTLVRPVYTQLAAQGWRYYKLDALRHLRYEGYNSFAADFRLRRLDREQSFRNVVVAVRESIGAPAWLLACWGIRPELVGLVDAVRVGTDGFGYGGFAQYNSWNNVVWRNDPDHVEIAKPDGYRAATIASLTGSLLMLTDPPDVYRTPRVEAARRTAPVLFTVPQQIFDVDPSRSQLIAGAATETSGSGSRPFDADRALVVPLYLLDVNRPFERWSVLARTGGEDTIRFASLGIVDDSPQLVFEFWTRRFVGAHIGGFAPGPIDPAFGVQVFCLRTQLPRPQLIATSRHVSCGGTELTAMSWDGATLEGASAMVANDPYELWITEPAGWRLAEVQVQGATVEANDANGEVRTMRLRSVRGGPSSWRIRYERTGGRSAP